MVQEFPDYYKANLVLLKKYHPKIWGIMTKKDLIPAGEVFLSPNGQVNLKIKNSEGKFVNLHDFDNPEAEVPLFLDMVHESSIGVAILIGMGLGYTPLALLLQRKNIRHLVVFEANPCIFAQALRYVDLSFMLADTRLILSVGSNPDAGAIFAPASRALKLEQIHMLQHVPSLTLDKISYQKLYDMVYSCVNQLNVSGSTTFRYGSEFIHNRFAHLSSIHHNSLLESLKKKFSGVPAIMVAGGPSLDKNIHLLKKAKNKAVILTVDTVLPTLLQQGIIPDFVTSIDPEEMTYEKFANVVPQIKGIPYLICSAWIHPNVPKLFPAEQVFWSFSGNSIEKWLNNLMGGVILTGGAGTVAHMNMIAAIIMGCSPIVFIGQDLAYSEDKDHAANVVLTNKDNVKNRLSNLANTVQVDGINGGKVTTVRGFLSLKTTFEKMIKDNPGHYINATEGGVHIRGTEVLPFQEVLDRYCINDYDIISRVKKIATDEKHIFPELFISEFQSVEKVIKKLRKYIKKADSLSKSVQIKIGKLDKSRIKYGTFDVLPAQLKKQISEIDFLHKKIDNEKKIWQLLEDITLEGLRQSERLLHKASLIKDDPSKYLDWLCINMNRFDAINNVRIDVLKVLDVNIERILNLYQTEKELNGRDTKFVKNERKLCELIRFYCKNDNYMLARHLIERTGIDTIDPQISEYAEINYFCGIIAAQQTDYDKFESHFQKALSINPDLKEDADKFRKKMGDKYLRYAQHQGFDRTVSIVMLLKGLRCCFEHKIIREKLNALFLEDLKKIQDYINSDARDKANTLVAVWYKHLKDNTDLAIIFNSKTISDFYKFNGKLLFFKGELSDAAESFGKVIKYTPDDPDIYIQMTEILFTQNKFDKGIEYLNKAVALNRNYAEYWGNIGDNLQKTGQVADAIFAYEQCFIVLPERIDILKKIGDCYRSLEQYDSASEAYKQFKQLSEK